MATSRSRKPLSNPSRALLALSVIVVPVLLLGGCAKFTEPYKDAPRSHQDNGAPADLVRMPDGFSNVATKCDHHNRIYVAFHNDKAFAAIAVVPNAEGC